jgi:energy-coupling factor transporter transmembrane protein EcfT
MSRLAEAFSFLPGSLSQIFVLSLALVPGVGDLAGNIVRSQKARGMNFRSPNIFTTYMPVLVPLFGKTLYKSEKMSLAMQARGYGKD